MKVELKYKYIFHDVKQLTVRYSEVRFAADGAQEVKDIAQINDIDTDNELVQRLCKTGVAKLNILLKDYLETKADNANDELTDESSWLFTFVETNMDGQSLASLMHWFVVKYCLYEWAKTFSPSDSAGIKEDLDETSDDLEDMVLSSWPVKARRKIDEEVSEIEIVYDNEGLSN